MNWEKAVTFKSRRFLHLVNIDFPAEQIDSREVVHIVTIAT